MMKKALPVLLAAALLVAPSSHAADIGLDLNLHIGNRSAAPIIVEEPPLFLVPPALGFQVAVGVPYDMFRIDGRYYLCRDDVWYLSAAYGGPWTVVQHKHLPPGLAKRRYAEIVSLRDQEYSHYKRDRDRYKGKAYRPGKKEKEEHGKRKHGKEKG